MTYRLIHPSTLLMKLPLQQMSINQRLMIDQSEATKGPWMLELKWNVWITTSSSKTW